MLVNGIERCDRCATILRNRTVCPSCGLDLNDTGTPSAEAGRGQIRPVAAKAGVKMCAFCMASVPAADLIDINGQLACAGCAEIMQAKTAKKGAPAPAPEKK